MNYASDDQLTAIGQLCKYFDSGGSKLSIVQEEISCELCTHWDGARCLINVFDNVLTSMDQT